MYYLTPIINGFSQIRVLSAAHIIHSMILSPPICWIPVVRARGGGIRVYHHPYPPYVPLSPRRQGCRQRHRLLCHDYRILCHGRRLRHSYPFFSLSHFRHHHHELLGRCQPGSANKIYIISELAERTNFLPSSFKLVLFVNVRSVTGVVTATDLTLTEHTL